MIDELTGQPGQATVAAPKEEQPTETPQEGKFAGKSAVEIATAYEELEKKIGTQGQELGQLKSTNEQLMTYLQQVAQQQPTQRPPEPTEQPTRWDWDNPRESTASVAKVEVGKELDKKFGEFYRVIRTQQAQTASGFAKMVAKQQYPHLFDGGTEAEVDTFMQNALRSGTVDPANVEKPEMWASMAYVIKGFKQNFNPQGTVSPVSPQYGETPAGARGRVVEDEGEPLDLAPEHLEAIRKVAKDTGGKEEEILKEFKQEQRKKGRK